MGQHCNFGRLSGIMPWGMDVTGRDIDATTPAISVSRDCSACGSGAFTTYGLCRIDPAPGHVRLDRQSSMAFRRKSTDIIAETLGGLPVWTRE